MKFSLVAISAFVAAVAAQDLSSLSPCGQMCVNNMVVAAQKDFGCAAGDIKCYCANPGFALGLRDCSAQACGDSVSSSVVAYGASYCSSLNGGTTTGAAATGTGTGTGTTTGTATSGVAASVSSVEASGSSKLSSIAASASGVAASAASSANSVVASASSSIAAAIGSASSKAGSASASATGSTSSSAGAGAMKTAAPLAGALGMAAILFI